MSDDRKLERLFDAAPEVVFGGFTGLQAPKERYADAAGWIVESECGLRLGPGADRGRAFANPVGSRDQHVPGGSAGRGAWSVGRR